MWNELRSLGTHLRGSNSAVTSWVLEAVFVRSISYLSQNWPGLTPTGTCWATAPQTVQGVNSENTSSFIQDPGWSLLTSEGHSPSVMGRSPLLLFQQTWTKAAVQARRRTLPAACPETSSKISCVCPWKEYINYHIRLAVIHHTVTARCAEFLTAPCINKLHSGPLVVFKFMLSVAIYCCPLG